MVSDANFDFWIKNNYNVIFRGKHGVGKTATILQAFGRANLKWQYFSASTMDPWVDFIGVPKERIDENGNSYLDLVRPKMFQEDQVEAIFLDEFNRSSKKVRNAVLELIQFKSINGKKFNNLKIIWAAINPEDDEDQKYDVEALDPAQLDRFHVIIDVPYTPNVPFFREKYGKQNGDVAVTWWKELTKEQQSAVSPRRLDYALDMYTKGGDLKFVLPNNVNTSKLLIELANGSISKKLDSLVNDKNEVEAKAFLNVENNFAACSSYLCKKKEYQSFFLPLLSDEKLTGLMSKDKSVQAFVFSNFSQFENIIRTVAISNSSVMARAAARIVKNNKALIKTPLISVTDGVKVKASDVNAIAPIFYSNKSADAFSSQYIYNLANINLKYSGNRMYAYNIYATNFPKDLTEDIANKAIKDLSMIIINSQKEYTLDRKMKKINGMINYACKFLIDADKPIPLSSVTIKQISKKLDAFII